jgi:hypothetical protein
MARASTGSSGGRSASSVSWPCCRIFTGAALWTWMSLAPRETAYSSSRSSGRGPSNEKAGVGGVGGSGTGCLAT